MILECQRQEVADRLSALDIERLYLPNLSNIKPTKQKHIPILAPPTEILKTRKRVIVIINDESQDLGILAYRQLQRDLGLNGGSVINFVKEVFNRSTDSIEGFDICDDCAAIEDKEMGTPGIIVLNTGQLLYSHDTGTALSNRSWLAKPKKSICHDVVQVNETWNRIEGHRTPKEHIKTVFDTILYNADFVATDAEIYVIAIQNGAENLLKVLDGQCKLCPMGTTSPTN